MRLAQFLILALALVALTAGIAHPRSLSGVQSAILRLAPAYEDRNVDPAVKRAQLDTIAAAVEAVTKNRNERALLLTIGWHETKFALRLGRNECRKYECDRGRARHYWQTWKLDLEQHEWDAMVGTGLEPTKRAAAHALTQVRRSYALCRREPDPIRATMQAYGSGKGCAGRVPKIDERMATFNRVKGSL